MTETECPSCDRTFDTEKGKNVHHTQTHGKSIVKQDVTCEWCGDEDRVHQSEITDNGRWLCSRDCYKEWQSEHYQGRSLSEEHAQRISEGLSGRELTEEHKQNLSKAIEGTERSEDVIQSMSEKQKGRTLSEETKQKMSEAKMGHEVSEETRQKLSEAKRGNTHGGVEVITVEETGNRVYSNWEKEIDLLLHESGLQYAYEPRTFKFESGRGYTPDFIVENSTIVEVKGHIWDDWDIERARKFREQYSDYEYVVVGNGNIPCDLHIPWEKRGTITDRFD